MATQRVAAPDIEHLAASLEALNTRVPTVLDATDNAVRDLSRAVTDGNQAVIGSIQSTGQDVTDAVRYHATRTNDEITKKLNNLLRCTSTEAVASEKRLNELITAMADNQTELTLQIAKAIDTLMAP